VAQSLVRTLGAAAIVWTAYIGYATIAVPLIEPEAAIKNIDAHVVDPSDASDSAGFRHDLLAELFEEGAWQLGHPKVIETDQAVLLFNEYKNQADGTVALWPCSMIFFRDAKEEEHAARKAIVLDAPDGATLRFDKPFDLGHASVGRLEAGRLLGAIKIYAQQEPGDADDLLITTRDVQLAPDRIWTPHPVNFRLGASYGSGTELRIHLLPRSDDAPRRHGPSIGGIRSVELAHEVKVHLDLGGKSLVPAAEAASGVAAAKPAPKQPKRSPPIEVTCRGPFQFDVVDSVATFNEQVNVLQVHENGQSDQVLSEVLSLYFMKRDREDKQDGAASSTGLALASIEAQGRPVIVHSPSTRTDVRCESLRFDVLESRLRLAGQNGVWLKREENEVTAASIDYAGAKGGRLGTLLAVGPGRIDARLGEKKDQSFTAEWTERLQIQPYKDRKVVSLVGDARSSSSQWGMLAASELHVYLTEVELLEAGAEPMAKPKSSIEIQPDAFKAVGQVQIDSPRLVGSTEDLVVWIENLPHSAEEEEPARAQKNAFETRPASAARQPQDRYKIHGGKIQVQLTTQTRGAAKKRHTQVANVVMKENAYFAEVPPLKEQDPAKQPLVVRGQDLRVDHADSPDTIVLVKGEPAHIEARGMSLDGAQINLDRQTNQFWIDGAGKLSLPVDRDLDGRALGTRDQLTIAWTGDMAFDGTAMRFRENVTASTAHQSLATREMTVTMTARVDFARTETQQKIAVHAVHCAGQVRLESETLDERGQRESWLRAVADNLEIVQSTGKLTADGPGWVKIVRRGAADAAAVAVSDRLTYLGVDFERGITGNVLPDRRQLTFSDQVKTVFGPIERWADELETAKRVASRPDNVLLSCDKLTVGQLPARAGAPASFDLAAEGGTHVEGKDFAAMASRLTYSESKDLLILDSDGLSDAKLFRNDEKGGRSELAARQIHYWPRSQKFRVFGARSAQSVAGQ
jgi:hypothetical protein